MSSSPLASDSTAARRPASGPVVPAPDGRRPAWRSDRIPDRLMRRMLGIRAVDPRSGTGAHRAFRIAVVISALRCLITYVAIPVLVPILSLGGWIAGPVGIVLCVVAAINGVVSVRRFWRTDHAQRWTYTAFIAVVFAILAVSTWTEASRGVAQL